MGVTWAVGQRLTAAALQDAFDFITPVVYTKPAVESRNTTTTYTDDDDLQGIPLGVGVYDIELVGFFTLTTTNTQKIKTRWVFSGTWNNPVRSCISTGSGNTAASDAASTSTMHGYNADNQDAIYDVAAGAGYTTFREIALNVTVTAAGNLSMQWAQSASSGNNTNLQAGTSFKVRRIS